MIQRLGTVRCLLVIGTTVLALAAPAAVQNGAAQTPARGGGGGRGVAQPTPPCGPAVSGKNIAKDSRCFELRTYTMRTDGAGNIDLLHKRFRDATVRLFTKHGMTIVGFWQPLSKPDTLIYLMAYKDNAAHDAEWAAFQADPEWVKARTDMNVAVTVENVFMNATDYSPLK
jgi:NIPSNAP protein